MTFQSVSQHNGNYACGFHLDNPGQTLQLENRLVGYRLIKTDGHIAAVNYIKAQINHFVEARQDPDHRYG